MTYQFDQVHIDKGQLVISKDDIIPKTLGEGEEKIKHSAYIYGPLQVGEVTDFDINSKRATVMIGKDTNSGATSALHVKGKTIHSGDIVQVGSINQSLGSFTTSGAITASGKVTCGSLESGLPKSFDIKHPSKEGWRLRYACIEGPEAGVYYRGRLKNQKIIKLPFYWKDLVSVDSITVQLQPIGAHQDIIVKRWDDENIYLQAQGGLPINCFYHVYAERNDIDKLEVEYEVDKPPT